MNIGLIIALVIVLLVLVIGYNIVLQYKVKVNAQQKHETARFQAIIDAAEDLIGNAHHLPYSKELLVCLNQRILDALESMYEFDSKNTQLSQRIKNISAQLKQLKENFSGGESTSFKTPTSDKQALVMLKLVKRLRDTIRSEHNKGRLDTQSFVTENARLESIQVRINIENVIKRANEAVMRGQDGTAKQLLKKGIDALATKNDSYSNQARQKLQGMLADMDQKRIERSAEELQAMESKENKSEMDVLFGGEKKKW